MQTWTRQGPARLLPTRHRAGGHRVPIRARTALVAQPARRVAVGRRAARSDLVVVVHYTTLQAPVLATIGRAARHGARVVVICANAVPRRRGDRLLTALLMRAPWTPAIVAHRRGARALAALTDRPVTVAALPPHLPDGPARPGRPEYGAVSSSSARSAATRASTCCCRR